MYHLLALIAFVAFRHGAETRMGKCTH